MKKTAAGPAGFCRSFLRCAGVTKKKLADPGQNEYNTLSYIKITRRKRGAGPGPSGNGEGIPAAPGYAPYLRKEWYHTDENHKNNRDDRARSPAGIVLRLLEDAAPGDPRARDGSPRAHGDAGADGSGGDACSHSGTYAGAHTGTHTGADPRTDACADSGAHPGADPSADAGAHRSADHEHRGEEGPRRKLHRP